MAMVQAVSYNFATVENPLSDGGLFVTETSSFGGNLKTISGNLCETVLATGAAASFYPTAAAPSGTWPADQYSEITLTTYSSASDLVYLLLRQGAAGSGTQYFAVLAKGAQVWDLWAFVSTASHHLVTTQAQASAQGDVFRLSITGNVLTLSRNGSVAQTFTDTNNYVAAGSPGFGFQGISPITATQTSLWAAGANQSATPTFSPVAGTYTGTQTVTITSATGGTIYYTTDGTTPTESSSSISSGSTISVASSETVKAIASLANNLDSAVGSAVYTINSASGGGSFVQPFRDFVNKRGNDDTSPKYW